ncbi:MAG: flagellar basal body P-ring formation chaperone FlgA [Pseudomonadota bacterium]
MNKLLQLIFWTLWAAALALTPGHSHGQKPHPVVHPASAGAAGFDAGALVSQAQHLVATQVAEQFPDAAVEIDIQPLHKAILHKRCSAFSVEVKGTRLFGRVPVMARCDKPHNWTFYLSAQVDVEVPVVISQRAITRGELLQADMLDVSWQPMATLRSGFLSDAKDLLGKVAKRAIRAHQPVYLHQVSTPWAVHKGDRVAIKAKIGQTYVATNGIAMQNGHIGEQISVRNEASQRMIRPWVWGPGTVGTRPQQASEG